MDGIPNSEFRTQNSSNWVGNVDEFNFEIVVVGDPAAESSDAEAFSRVVARGHIMDTILGGLVHDPLGGFASHIGIESSGYRLVELALSAAGHDAHRRHQTIAAGEDLGLAIACLGDGCKKLLRLHSLWKDATHPGWSATVQSEAFELLKSEATGKLGGVAKLEMSIQRQVVGDQ